ncbi:ThiF family adenylyltransferase [Aquimarina sp. 2201CG5-10]|uniref:HesA/MoeB/ThiF family protein n=1 Tax=Aquimarina callyspongiae TaxID=3098150 RepID=UPI002AB38560|nr:ThiF family adenylyltransferase [Aquimarina sp. 2201CG5-10]MDY8137852.1 ThiF family adenylyltransferase [Aquimarina sp. 2201CG5-10]
MDKVIEQRETKKIPEMHDDERYHKNVLYIKAQEQDKIKNTKILFGGVGLGSVIAEAALRLGFENFVFIDGDEVEISNLNRQNYDVEDINKSKVEAITKRLKKINPDVTIEYHHLFLEPSTISKYVEGCDIAINAIDFDTAHTPFVFDEVCKEKGISVIHPLNFGWGGAAYVVTPDSEQIYDVERNDGRFELILIENMLEYLKERKDMDLRWFYDFFESYKKNSTKITPPQLVVGSHLAAALVSNILFCLVNNLEVKTFPEPYFLSTR